MKTIRLRIILPSVAILLCIPFAAMLFSDQVNWGLFDFLVMGVLLFGTGVLFDLVLRNVLNIKYRIALLIAVIAVFLMIWAELAVGIFGSPFAGS